MTHPNPQNPIGPFTPETPQPLIRETKPGESYPVNALGPLRNAVMDVQGTTLAPMAIPAASALSIASLAVQGFRDVETLGGRRPLSLYALTIAQSGERKSSCDAPFMAALRDYERKEAKIRRDDLVAWENAHALWKGERDRILADARKGKGEKRLEAEAELEALGKEPAVPSCADRTVTEPTYEGLTRKFSEGMPTLGIFSDEGGQFLGGFAMSSENRQKTLTALNDLWQGNPIRRTRQGEGSYTLYGRRLAVHLMVQPGVARDFISDPKAVDTGFLPRFLICEPASTIGTRLQSQVRAAGEGLDAFSARLTAILETALPMNAEAKELEPVILPLSDDAWALLSGYSDNVEAKQAAGCDYANITGFASKAAEQAARIAGVLTAWEDLAAQEVAPKTMAHAITLANYYLGEARRLADAANISAKVERAEALRKWLLETWTHDEVLPSDVVQRAPIRTLRESPVAREAIVMLEKHGWLVRLPDGVSVRGTARKEAYRIVRLGHDV